MNDLLPVADQEYWEKIKREEPLSAIAKCEEAAKQLIALTSLTITIYIGIISFGDILKQPLALRPTLLFLLLPLPFWLTSLILATRVIVPRAYAAKQIQEDYLKISRVKYSLLRWSYYFLIISMLALIAVIALYLLFVPPPPV
jgi:hypothetical protein